MCYLKNSSPLPVDEWNDEWNDEPNDLKTPFSTVRKNIGGQRNSPTSRYVRSMERHRWVSPDVRLQRWQNAIADQHSQRKYESHPALKQLLNTRFPRISNRERAIDKLIASSNVWPIFIWRCWDMSLEEKKPFQLVWSRGRGTRFWKFIIFCVHTPSKKPSYTSKALSRGLAISTVCVHRK